MKKNDKEGVIFKGYFIPAGGGLNTSKSTQFFNGGIDGISVALLAANHDASVVTQNKTDMAKIYRIRKLTPRECFRLMGVSDKDIDKLQSAGISESQQYKLAGNSIVVDTLLHGIYIPLFAEQKGIEETLF